MAKRCFAVGVLLATLRAAAGLRLIDRRATLASSGGAAVGPRRVDRRDALALSTAALAAVAAPNAAFAKCQSIDECREIGERKVEAADAANPTFKLADGVRYKNLKSGGGGRAVAAGDVVDVAFSISTAGGSYMYSRGFGFEKDAGGNVDTGDFLKATLGARDVPAGIEAALVGMRPGDRRRVELPPGPAGFESSDYRPAPTSRRGKATITSYKRILAGNGSNQPPFPQLTLWDLEVRRVR